MKISPYLHCKVFEKPEATEWRYLFCTLEDKLGVNWSLMCGTEE